MVSLKDFDEQARKLQLNDPRRISMLNILVEIRDNVKQLNSFINSDTIKTINGLWARAHTLSLSIHDNPNPPNSGTPTIGEKASLDIIPEKVQIAA
jgi:hypothetical protein